ncbi:hypothetical protein [Embleya sp. NPDC001921]
MAVIGSRVASVVLVGAIVVSATACTFGEGGSAGSAEVPMARVAEHLRIAVPASATDTRWTYDDHLRGTPAVLSFVIPTDEVGTFLVSARVPSLQKGGQGDGLSFEAINLPQPEALPGVQSSSRQESGPALTVNVVPQGPSHSRVYCSGWK